MTRVVGPEVVVESILSTLPICLAGVLDVLDVVGSLLGYKAA
jgi:hypothetical protein